MKPFVHNVLLALAGMLAAALLFLSPGLRLPLLDDAADAYFRAAITKGGLSYATCRMINASVSIIEESSLHLEPAGVGISLAVGQALDPIDDLTERVSDLLVTAVISLGVQKLAYEIGISLAPPTLAVLLALLSLLVWFGNTRITMMQQIMVRLAVLLVAARLCLPLSSLVNDGVYNNFFKEQIEEASSNLSAGSAGLSKLKDFSLPQNGIFGTALLLQEKSANLRQALQEFGGNIGHLTENLLQLAFLYLGILVIQVLLLPLFVFFMLAKTLNALFDTRLPGLPLRSPV